jgi:F-type H+-transporting ATPase subunit a
MELDVFHLFLWEPLALEGTPFAINRVVILMFVAAFLTLAFFLIGAAKASSKPKGIGLLAETGYLFVRNNIAIDVIGPEGARFAPYLATIFFFIFFSNLLEIIPGISFPVTSRMALPAVLALATWVVYNFVGIKNHGMSYFKDTLFPPGVPWPIYIILTPIELFSVFIIRPLTLAIRLFANMLAGHVLVVVFILFTDSLILSGIGTPLGILTFLVTMLLLIFEFMVIVIQAYIFTTLSAFYIAEALEGHGDHEGSEAGGSAHHEHANPNPQHVTELSAA